MAAPYPTSGPASATPYPPGPGQQQQAVEFKTTVQLLISCSKLVDKDVFSKSDPICVVDMLQGSIDVNRGTFTEIGRTEHIKDNLNPSFTTAITVDYRFEEVQHLRFILYDVDAAGQDLRSGGGELLGSATTQLGKIVAAGTLETELELAGKSKGKSGKIKIVSEEVSAVDEKLEMTWSATKLDKKDFFGKSDPFFEFARANPDGSFTAVHRTEVIKNTLNPTWRPFSLSSRQLCNSDPSRQIQVNCHDWDSDGSTDYIGSCITTLGDLRSARLPKNIELVNDEKKKKKKSYQNSGVAHLQVMKVTRNYSFYDYISHGCELNFVVGVDFTGSNGSPSQPNSLHYLSPTGVMNEYQRALWAVGSICEQYDTDKLFPAFGFGAKVPPTNQYSSIFNLGIGSETPECHGVAGILAAYQSAISQVQLWGPTNAAPIVNAVVGVAETEHNRIQAQKWPCTSYQILLLLTDGILTDMEQTKAAIIRGSRLPMSVIIVGVGGADFKDMEDLDADDGLLEQRGQKAMRDIVQFVPFSQYASRPPEHLAKDVLAEVPNQLVQYMRSHELPINQRPS